MLGLADRGALRRLFEALLAGDPQALIAEVDNQYSLGVEPLALMRALMDYAHRITVAQIGKSGADAPTAEERAAIEGWAERLSAGKLHRLWQLLLKGHDEVRGAPDPLVAAQMALLRVLHAAELPDPGELAKKLEGLAANGAPAVAASNGNGAAPAPAAPLDWSELVERVKRDGQHVHASKMKLQVRVAELEPGRLVYSLASGFREDLSAELRDGLLRATGERWRVEFAEQQGAPSLEEQREAAKVAEQDRIRNTPIVKAAFEAFPEAELVDEDKQGVGGANWSKRA
jgi:DNA polymerase-3 subunit gamma/tau